MKISKEIKSAIIGISAIALTIWGYSYLKKQNLFNTSRMYYSKFNNIQGLTKASIVTINGFQVGNVNSINFNPNKKGELIVGYSLFDDFTFSKNSTTKIIPGLMGGAEFKIIPSYDGENATSGSYLIGSSDAGMMSSIETKLAPLDTKLNTILLDADKLLVNINNTLNEDTQQNIRASISKLNQTLSHFKNASKSLETLLADNTNKFGLILDNTNAATQSLKTMTNDIEQANLAGDIKQTITKLNGSLSNVDVLIANFNTISKELSSGKGSIGKLLKDDGLYINLENATKEMEELMREMKEHPKRFVHFSLFGKKDKKGYVEDTKK
ncbi:MAG: MlaD family protein [Flavobacteriaceae bacterium]